jgi:hypothetical protein
MIRSQIDAELETLRQVVIAARRTADVEQSAIACLERLRNLCSLHPGEFTPEDERWINVLKGFLAERLDKLRHPQGNLSQYGSGRGRTRKIRGAGEWADNKESSMDRPPRIIQGMADYAARLRTPEWKGRRDCIVSRDGGKCKLCGRSGDDGAWDKLDVHHRYYIIGRQPWEYPDEALWTLCRDCHTKLHKASQVPFVEEVDGKLVVCDWVVCAKCHGAGRFECYREFADGVCYRCRGTGLCRIDYGAAEILSLEDVSALIKHFERQDRQDSTIPF